MAFVEITTVMQIVYTAIDALIYNCSVGCANLRLAHEQAKCWVWDLVNAKSSVML